MMETFLPLKLNLAVIILGHTEFDLIKAFAADSLNINATPSTCACSLFILVFRVNQLPSSCQRNLTYSIPSAFADSKHHDILLAHLVCHLGGPSCLVQGTDIPYPNLSPALHRQKNRFRPYGFQRDFTRWRQEEKRPLLEFFVSAYHSKNRWWVISPVSFTRVPVGQGVSG